MVVNNPVVLTVILQLAAVVVIIAEFLIPSMGLLSVAAAGLLGYSLYVVFTQASVGVGMVFLACDAVMVPVLVVVGMHMLGRSPAALHQKLGRADGVSSQDEAMEKLVGKTGVVVSDCRPAGRALIEGRKYDVVTAGDFLEQSTPVVVKEVSGNRVVVAKNE
jgi:membrane-bound ClpP family serine protease